MKIKMNKTRLGSINGINAAVYKKNREYTVGTDITETVAKSFIKKEHAEMLTEKEETPEIQETEEQPKKKDKKWPKKSEAKMLSETLENKALGGQDNK